MNNTKTAIETLIKKLKNKGIDYDTLPTAIYARKSTKDTSQVSIDGQVDACMKFVNDNPKLKLVETYSEENVTGYHIENRKQIQSLIRAIKNGTIRVVVAYSLDRVSRNIVDGSCLDKLIEESGAIILYTSQSFSDDADGNFNKNILRAVAQREPEKTAETTIRSLFKNTKELKSNGARVPYGFDVIEQQYIINETEAPAVRMMFKGVLDGRTIPEIIDLLTSKGYFTRANKPFSPQTVHRILRSVKYKGTYLYNDANGRKRKDRVLRGEFDEVRIENGIPSIVDTKTFDRVQTLLTGKNTTTTKAVNPYTLTGIIECGCCGNSMHGSSSYSKSKRRYTHYTCKGGKSRNACNLAIRQEYIDRATAVVVSKMLNELKKDKMVMSSVILTLKKSARHLIKSLTNGIATKQREIEGKTKALSNTTNATVIEVISEQIENLVNIKKKQEKELENQHQLLSLIENNVKKFISGINEITADDILEDETIFRGLSRMFIKKITITKEEVSFEFNDLSE